MLRENPGTDHEKQIRIADRWNQRIVTRHSFCRFSLRGTGTQTLHQEALEVERLKKFLLSMLMIVTPA
jgi:hypothetical protein